MHNLFRVVSEDYIYEFLKERFDHPATLLFRGKELVEIKRYIDNNPLNIGLRTLDLGCGEGYIGSMLFNKIDVGLDIGEDLKMLKGSSVYKNAITASAIRMPFKDKAFDIIFSNSTIEHIPELEELLKEITRILSGGGLFIFTVPTSKFSDFLFSPGFSKKMNSPLKVYSRLRNKQLNHYNLFNDAEWGRRLKKFSLIPLYAKYYLSHSDIYEWDKMCVALRLTKKIRFVHRFLKNKFYKKAEELLIQKHKPALFNGAGLLMVVKKAEDN